MKEYGLFEGTADKRKIPYRYFYFNRIPKTTDH